MRIKLSKTLLVISMLLLSAAAFARTNRLFRDRRVRMRGNTYTFQGGTRLSYYSNGRVRFGKLARDMRYTLRFPGGRSVRFLIEGAPKRIFFHKNGRPKTIYLRRPVFYRFNRLRIRINRRVTFYDTGYLKSAYTRRGFYYKGARFKSGYVYFHKNGNLRRAYLKRDSKIQGYWFKRFSSVEFHDNGRIARGRLARSVRKRKKGFLGRFKKKKSYRAGQYVRFDRRGRIR